MQIFTPCHDGVRVKQYVLEHDLKKIGLVFLHGLGDTLMFRSVLESLQKELPDVAFTVLVHASQEPLIPGAQPWEGFEKLEKNGFEATFILEFPVQGAGYTKAQMCAETELGLAENRFEIKPLRFAANRLVVLHFFGTCTPDATNPDEGVMHRIHDIVSEEDGIPLEIHFEHAFHDPRNTRPDWCLTHVRGHYPTPRKMYSLIASAGCFVGVVSGPLIMALAIDPARVICLQKQTALRDFTAHCVPIVDINDFDESHFRQLLREKLGD